MIVQLTPLGTGVSAPDPNRRGPAQLLRAGHQNILIDCGSGVVHQLVRAGVRPTQIDHVFITHHHSDHYIDLDHFMLTRWIFGDDRPLHVYGPRRQKQIVETILRLHDYDLRLRIKQRGATRELPKVVVHEIDEGEIVELDGLRVTAFRVEHPPIDDAFCYRFDTVDRSIVLSGDTRPCENLVRHARGADVLVHECMDASKTPFAAGSGWDSAEQKLAAMAKYHTFPEQLGLIARDAMPKLLVTTHMTPLSVPQEIKDIIRSDYSGYVVIGEDLMTV